VTTVEIRPQTQENGNRKRGHYGEQERDPGELVGLDARLVCRDPRAAIDFYVNVFNALSLNERPGPDGRVAHALLQIGPAMFMVEGDWPNLAESFPSGGR
jgi:hypothetical protein